jgi:pimeloyl-ACP methyl ester carboxylesterase
LAGADRGFIAVPAGWVEVLQFGQGDPIVMMPGLAGGWRMLVPLAKRLAGRHRVVLLGLPGDRGFPTGPESERPCRQAAVIASVLESLCLERPAVLGLSYGGAIALELALRHPGLVGRLALMGVEARFSGTPATTVARGVLERVPLPCESPILDEFFGLLHGGRPAPADLGAFIAARWWDTDQGVMAMRLDGLHQFDVSERLWELDVPTLVVAGSRDAIVTPDQQRNLAEAISGAVFEPILGAGHLGFLTHRDALARLVCRWMRVRARSFRS